MKILIFTEKFPENDFLGGAEIQAYLLAKYLAAYLNKIVFVALNNSEKPENKIVENFVVKLLPKSNRKKIKFTKTFKSVCLEEKPDLVFIRDFRYLFVVSYVCKKLNIPAIYNTTHINNCQPYPKKIKLYSNPLLTLVSIKSALMHYLNFLTLKKVNLLTINKYHARLLKDKYNIAATPIYNSMEDHYQDQENKPSQKEKNIVWVANLKDRKKPEIFLQLADQLKNSGYNFIMIGYLQNNVEFYQRLINETKNTNPNFKYLGGLSVEEVNRILARSEIFVNTCLPEGFGNNFIQAWLNECPTVTLYFDPDDIIKNNQIGFHSGSYEQLLKDIKYLIDNPEKTKALGRKARRYALINHLPEINMPKYEGYFKSIIINQSNAQKN